MSLRSLSIVLMLFINTLSFSQSATIRGFVYNKKNGEPVIFTNVYLKGTSIGAQTDVNGYYSIKVVAGEYSLAFTAVGYDSVFQKVVLRAGQIMQQNIYVQEAEFKLKEFQVTAEKQEEQNKVGASIITITPKEIDRIPGVGGSPDIAQYMQVVPGVVMTGDQGGQLYIRGGSPIQNKVLLDGMIIYNPFHSIGLFSVFDTDVIRSTDVYTGGFGAEFGGRVSSIMKMTTRDGNKKRFGGKVAVSPFVSKILFEGPLSRQKENSASASSFIVSARTSYLEQSSKIFYPYVDSAGLPFNFTDLYGKISFSGDNGSKLNVSAFNFTDRVKYKSLQNLSWNTAGAGTNFVLIPNNTNFVLDGAFSYSNYKIKLEEVSRPSRSSQISGFNVALNFKYYLTEKSDFQWGVEALGFTTDYTFFNEVNREINQNENTTELALYAKYRVVLGKLVLDPSFRLHYYASLGEASPEPRLGLKYNITDRLRIKFAGGLYSQNLIAGVSDRDVVNLFYGFLSAPENSPTQYKGEEITSKLQKARHLIAGVEGNITKYLKLNVEAYMFDFNQLTNINRNKLYDEGTEGKPDVLTKDFIIEKGKSQGVDMLLKYEYKRFYVWAVYSLMKVTREDDLLKYAPVWDRRHNINVVVSYNFGKSLDWDLSCRWNYGSGFPFTQTQGNYENFNPTGNLNTDYTSGNGALGTLYGPLNQGRLPAYHRLDINVKKTFAISENSIVEISAGATNIYNRENIFYFDRVKFQRINQLPVLPSIGANWKF